jgi:hypothetical protein
MLDPSLITGCQHCWRPVIEWQLSASANGSFTP